MKKGFTLPEVLGIIVIISILLLLIIPTIINGVKDKEGDVGTVLGNIIYEASDELLKTDEDKYPQIPGDVYCISIGELIDHGKLVEPVKKITSEGNYSRTDQIKISIGANGEKIHEMVEDNTCSERRNKAIIIKVSPSNNIWTTMKTATIIYPDLEDGKTYELQYRIDKGSWVNASADEVILDFPLASNIKEKYEVEARMIDQSTKKTILEKVQPVEAIDNENPTAYITLGNWNESFQQQVNITMSDTQSGVAGYCIKPVNEKPTDPNDGCFKNFRLPAYGGTGTVAEFLGTDATYSKKYYLWVKDKAGRITDLIKSGNNDYSFKIEDLDDPTCTIVKSTPNGENGWHTSNATITITVKDNTSGVLKYDINSSNNAIYDRKITNSNVLSNIKSKTDARIHTTDTAYQMYYGHVMDKAGRINRCQLVSAVKKDSVKPTCSINKSCSKSGTNGWCRGSVTVSFTDKSDNVSGVASYGIGVSKTSDNQDSKTYSGETRGITYYGYVKDKAGLENTCGPESFKIDKTPPVCVWGQPSVPEKEGDKSYVSATCTDNLSGVTTPSSCKNVQVTGGVLTCSATDGAGNSSDNSASIEVPDTEGPTIQLSLTPVTHFSSNWKDYGDVTKGGTVYCNQGKCFSGHNVNNSAVDRMRVDFKVTDDKSGVKSYSASCTGTLDDDKNQPYNLAQTKEGNRIMLKANMGRNQEHAIVATCTVTAEDNSGNKSSKTVKGVLGNGWYNPRKCQGDGFTDYHICINTTPVSVYYENGKVIDGWQNLRYYDSYTGANEWRTYWHYFYKSEDSAYKANSCFGERYAMAHGWCHDGIGGYDGDYYFMTNGENVKHLSYKYPGGAMFNNETVCFAVNRKSYTFNSSGRLTSEGTC